MSRTIKRQFSLLLAVISIFTLMATVTPSTANAEAKWGNLPKVGACSSPSNRGGHVLGLQMILWIRGYSSQPNSGNDDTGDKWYPSTTRNLDGVAGQYTRNGIYWMQLYNGLGADSCAGPATWAKARNFLRTDGTRGCAGRTVYSYKIHRVNGGTKGINFRRDPINGSDPTRSWQAWTYYDATLVLSYGSGYVSNRGYWMRPGTPAQVNC